LSRGFAEFSLRARIVTPEACGMPSNQRWPASAAVNNNYDRQQFPFLDLQAPVFVTNDEVMGIRSRP
jgi:hypothetical protein